MAGRTVMEMYIQNSWYILPIQIKILAIYEKLIQQYQDCWCFLLQDMESMGSVL